VIVTLRSSEAGSARQVWAEAITQVATGTAGMRNLPTFELEVLIGRIAPNSGVQGLGGHCT